MTFNLKEKKMRIIKSILSIIIGIPSYVLLWFYYDWKLPLLIFLMMWANNLSVWVAGKQEKERERTEDIVSGWQKTSVE